MVLTEKKTDTQKATEVMLEKPAVKSYFGSISVDAQEEPLFEIEKEYNNFDIPSDERQRNLLPEFEVLPEQEKQAVKIAEVEQEKDVRLSLRGKILAVVGSMITVLLLTLVIYNAVVLGAKRSEVNMLTSQLEVSMQELASLESEYGEVQSEESVAKLLKNGGSALRKATDADKIVIGVEEYPVESVEVPSNWFDKICEFLSDLFR